MSQKRSLWKEVFSSQSYKIYYTAIGTIQGQDPHIIQVLNTLIIRGEQIIGVIPNTNFANYSDKVISGFGIITRIDTPTTSQLDRSLK